MTSQADNNKRIAKNTLVLYFRMFITMVVSLYTSRVVLNTLGVEDYGIYNVVGGIVLMFSFINGAMATATQRFLSVEIGRNDLFKLKKVFSIALSTHLMIAVVVVVLAETLGLWFLKTQMNIPADRMAAALWVYHFSVFSFAVSIIQVPYNASIIAYEKMNVFAYVSIVEVVLKLVIVFALVWFGFDKLKLYAILTTGVTITIMLIYLSYCRNKFESCRYTFYRDKTITHSLLSFSGWSLFGTLAWVMMGQGLNILLNIFFGPLVNASRGIAFQVNAVVTTFINNFRMAVTPQIVKSYAAGNHEYMQSLIFESSKYSYFLLLFVSLPIMFETNILLYKWLKIVPEHAVLFCQLILINTLIQSFDIGVIFTAMGRIKENQLIGGIIYILIIPASYLLLKSGYAPDAVFYSQIIATVLVVFGVNIYLMRRIAMISFTTYFQQLLLPVLKVSFVAIPIPLLIRMMMTEGAARFFILLPVSAVTVLLSVFYVGMNKNTRIKIIRLAIDKTRSFIRPS